MGSRAGALTRGRISTVSMRGSFVGQAFRSDDRAASGREAPTDLLRCYWGDRTDSSPAPTPRTPVEPVLREHPTRPLPDCGWLPICAPLDPFASTRDAPGGGG